MSQAWSNWSRSVACTPDQIARPRTEAELAQIVRAATKVRVVGAGHSFMPLCATEGTLIDLSDLEGEIEVAPDRHTVWAPAGWSLARLTRALWREGLSLRNQGDVNPQSLAGAVATGTHGTGAELGSLSTFTRGFRVVLADGSILECDASVRPEQFQALRLSLGLLGVVTRIQIDVMPAYRLEERIECVPFGRVLEEFESLAARHRHVEFFMFPYSDHVILKTLQPTEDDEPLREPDPNEEKIFATYCRICATLPALTGFLQRRITGFVRSTRRVGPAYAIFPSQRTVRFEEMEYELPRAIGLRALGTALEWIRRKRLPITFPFEFRWVAGDDLWLSPFNRGPGASVSVHQYARMPWQEFFDGIEPVFRAHGGRPHWAKRHTMTARDVFEIYPQARRFCEIRAELDPTAKFANSHLAALFDISRRSTT